MTGARVLDDLRAHDGQVAVGRDRPRFHVRRAVRGRVLRVVADRGDGVVGVELEAVLDGVVGVGLGLVADHVRVEHDVRVVVDDFEPQRVADLNGVEQARHGLAAERGAVELVGVPGLRGGRVGVDAAVGDDRRLVVGAELAEQVEPARLLRVEIAVPGVVDAERPRLAAVVPDLLVGARALHAVVQLAEQVAGVVHVVELRVDGELEERVVRGVECVLRVAVEVVERVGAEAAQVAGELERFAFVVELDALRVRAVGVQYFDLDFVGRGLVVGHHVSTWDNVGQV